MDIRSFVIGAVFGGLVYAGVSTLLPGEPPSPRAQREQTAKTAADSLAGQPGATAQSPDPSQPDVRAAPDIEAGTVTSSESQESPPGAARALPDSESSPRPVAGTPEQPESSGDAGESAAPQHSWMDSHRARLAEQSKDDSWAYFMEQALLQFFSEHPGMSQFTLNDIDCRTSICQIVVTQYHESAGPTWQRIMYDMTLQPWYEFGQVGTSSGDVEDQVMVLTELHRLPES